jgi:hypothetical protein
MWSQRTIETRPLGVDDDDLKTTARSSIHQQTATRGSRRKRKIEREREYLRDGERVQGGQGFGINQ